MTSAHKLVYIETSVVSYLTARPTSDLLAAAWQKTTADWWEEHRSAYNVCTSFVSPEICTPSELIGGFEHEP